MNYELSDSNQTPPCGWTYLIPETGLDVEAGSLEELLDAVRVNLELNQIPYDRKKIYPEVLKSICERSPTGTCRNFVNRLFVRSREVMNGTIALSIMIRKGKGAFVSGEVAMARAVVCKDCSFNIENPGCVSCKGFKSIIDGAKRGRSTTLDGELNTCGVCKCFIQALVHMDVAVLAATTNSKQLRMYPAYCWKKKLLTKGA